MARPDKAAAVAELTEDFRSSNAAVLTEYRGLTVAQMKELRRSLGTKVSLARSRKGGRIVIEYYSDEELGRLYERLTGGTA